MAKIMLVEDDNNLREIYGARLLAEGYEIVSAKDGEEALAMAVKEKPDLIISDIMMPKISGFDMLDILRSTAETKHTKVIMMTALSQIEDKERADRLGADRYLVKSQVTLEDVATAAREVLNDTDAGQIDPVAPTAAAEATPAPEATAEAAPAAETPAEATETPVPTPPEPVAESPAATEAVATPAPEAPAEEASVPTPVAAEPVVPTPTPTPTPEPVADPAPVADSPAPVNPVTAPTTDSAATPAATVTAPQSSTEPAAAPEATAAPVDQPVPVVAPGGQSKTSVHTKVITPINDMTAPGPDLNALLAAEEAKTPATPVVAAAPAQILNDITPAPATITPAAPAAPAEPVTPETPTPPITIQPLV